VATNKDQLEKYIGILDILLLCFAGVVAIGVTGEYFFHLPRFGRWTALGVDGEAVLGFVSFLQNRRLRTLQEGETALLRRDVAEANRSAEQEKLARVRIEERLARRHLTDDNLKTIIAALRPLADAGRLIDVVKYPNDSEVAELAYQLTRVLKDAGWNPAEYGLDATEPISGILIEIDGSNPPTRVAANTLVSALSAAGLSVAGPASTLPRTAGLSVPIGTRPVGGAIRVTIGGKNPR
jgi:hypothetical protein